MAARPFAVIFVKSDYSTDFLNKPVVSDNKMTTPPPPLHCPRVYYEVERVIGVSSEGSMKRYQVEWAPTWVSAHQLVGCEHLVQKFNENLSKMTTATSKTTTATSKDEVEAQTYINFNGSYSGSMKTYQKQLQRHQNQRQRRQKQRQRRQK